MNNEFNTSKEAHQAAANRGLVKGQYKVFFIPVGDSGVFMISTTHKNP